MSRHLPMQPNLEHLRNQAKDLLSELRLQDASVKLADAQHALARDYGFATWAQLKSFVESLPPSHRADAPTLAAELRLAGTWVANVSKSARHPLNEYRSAMLEFTVDGDLVTIDDVVVDAAGRTERTRNVLRVDGRERPRDHGFVVMAQWRGPAVIDALVKRGDVVESRIVYQVSSDGQTLTLTAGDQLHHFDRC